MSAPHRPGIGDNGGPPLDDPARPSPAHAPRPYDAACSRCLHWKPPTEREESDYRAWQGGYGRRVKEPSGYCHRIRHRPGGPIASGGTMGRSFCYNFERKPDPEPEWGEGRAFVTIWQGDKIAWQGRGGEEPAEFRQGELDL